MCWADVTDPSKGFKYIYFTKEDYQALMLKYKNDEEAMPLICSRIDGPNGEVTTTITIISIIILITITITIIITIILHLNLY